MKYNCQFYEINDEVEFERDPSDKHFLELKKFKKTKIIKPTDFLQGVKEL